MSARENLTGEDEVIVVLDRAPKEIERQIKLVFRNAGPRLVLAESQGEGITQALITGCNLARGEYIARLDGDDLILPGRFERQLELLEQKTNVVAVGGQAQLIDQNGMVTGQTRLPIRSWQIRAVVKFSNPLIHPAMVYRTSAMRAVGGYSPWVSLAQDYDLAIRLMEVGEIVNLREKVIGYRVHTDQISSTRSRERVPFVANTLVAANLGSLSYLDAHKIADLQSQRHDVRLSMAQAFFLFLFRRPAASCLILLAQGIAILSHLRVKLLERNL